MKRMVVKILGAALLLGAMFLPNAFASVNPKETSWTTLTPPTRSCFRAEVVDGKIYSYGCELKKSYSVNDTIIYDMEVYDPSKDTWTSLDSIPAMDPSFNTQVVNGKIYAIGRGMRNDNPVDIEVYDSSTNTWSALPPMPTARLDFRTEAVDGKLYVIGGGNNYGVKGATEVYNPSKGTWTTLASMPTYFDTYYTTFNTGVVDGKIYAMGIDMDGKGYLEVYNPSTDTWTMLSSMQTARVCSNTEVVDGKIYAIGGYNADFKQLFSIEAYDPSTDTWTTLPSMPTTRSDFETEVVDGKIYAIGGCNADFEALKSTEVYDPSKNTWTTLAPTENFIGIQQLLTEPFMPLAGIVME